MATRKKVEEKKVSAGIVYDFTKVTHKNIMDQTEDLDLSKIVANLYYNITPDIGQMDKAREIFHTGKTEFTKDECRLFERAIVSSELPAVVKEAIQNMFKED